MATVSLPSINKDHFLVESDEKEKRSKRDEKHPAHKDAKTRLPPAGKHNSLVRNGDVSHQRLPPSNRNGSLVGRPNGDVGHHSNRNGNIKRQTEKHVSSIQTNEAAHSSRNQTKDKNDVEKMSLGSRSSNHANSSTVEKRNLSPKTDTTEYRSTNPRANKPENGQPSSPRTEKSNESRTSSDSRGRSKEFYFRWNAPSRNISPEATDKSSSPPIKQFKPSAQIQSFYAYLYGRAKKRNSLPVSLSKPKGILGSKDSLDKERPHSFVYLRSQTNKRSEWDTHPEELTYKPSTNGPEEISRAYVGEDSIREAEMAAKLQQMEQGKSKNKENKGPQRRTKVPPWYENEYVLNRRQAGVYKNMTNTYGSQSKKQREQRFVQRLAEYEVYKAKQQWEELLEKERRKRETKERQMLQLNELRQRFEDEAYHRFHTQYVTSRVLEHEKMNRNDYGLPEDLDEEPENAVIIKRKKVVPKSLITEETIRDIYQKKFNKIFDINKGNGLGRRPKTPKMEGIDTVVLEVKDNKGNAKERKRMVKDVIDAAEKQLKVNQEERKKLSTPVGDKGKSDDRAPSTHDIDLDDDSDDDDMDDIFEKARRKYDLDVDD